MSSSRAVDTGIPSDQWRKVHGASPLLNAGSAIIVLMAFVLLRNLDTWRTAIEDGWFEQWGIIQIVTIAAAAVLAIAALVALASWISWRKTSFALTGEAFWYRSGVLFRTQKHALLERVQSVDITYPFVPRLLGLGKIRIGVAGTSDLTFGYLKRSDLEKLRAEILARAAGVEEEAEAPENIIYSVSWPVLLAATLFRFESFTFVIAAVASITSTIVVFALSGDSWGFLIATPTSIAFLAPVFAMFARDFGFTTALSPDGIRVRNGLFEHRAQTIPPRRIHAVRISQPFIWRIFGWYRVNIVQAQSSAESMSTTTLLPVGSLSDALLALWLVIPDLGVENRDAFLESALRGFGPGQGFTTNPNRSKWMDPLEWKRRGASLTKTCLVIRGGRLRRRATFVPYARVQSLGVRDGLMQRLFRVFTLSAHIVPGVFTANVLHMEPQMAASTLAALTKETRVSRQIEPPERWMLRVEEALADD